VEQPILIIISARYSVLDLGDNKVIDFNQEADGKALLYNFGTWSEIDEPVKFLTEYPDTWEKAMTRNGYETSFAKFGVAGTFCVEVYHASKEDGRQKAPRKYLIDIDLGTWHQHVYVDNYRSLLQLLKELTPIASAAIKTA